MRFAICALAGALALTAPAAATDTIIHAGVLIADPREAPQTERSILIEDGAITAIRAGYVRVDGAEIIDLRGYTVTPGLIDSHVHLTSELGPAGRLDTVQFSDADYAMKGAHYARLTLEAGFTTVQDVGARGDDAIFALRDAIARGEVVGPRIRAAGHSICASGGHCDNRHGYNEPIAATLRRPSVCDGPADCRRAVREQIRRGADVIKITATGGVLSNTAAGTEQQLFDDELEAIVQAAAMTGRRVTAHAHGKSGIDAALEAGVLSIEHGTYLDNESIRLFRRTGAYLVPTVLAGVTVAELADKEDTFLTPPQRVKSRVVGPLMLDMLRRAHAGGVKIAFGTDSGVSAHGDNARELELMVEAGMSPQETLIAATVNAADHLGLSEEIGTIATGKSADIVAVSGDPLADMAVFREVSFVMARGRVAKAPGAR